MRQLWGLLVATSFLWLSVHTPMPVITGTPEVFGPFDEVVRFYTQQLWLALIIGSVLTALCWFVWNLISSWWR